MKTILVIRHAKSSWAHPGMSDFDRPLNERGHRDAPLMAERLRLKKIQPDLLVSSPARRALETCRHFANTLNNVSSQIITIPSLYHTPAMVFYEVIRQFPATAHTIAIFSHNPGITDFVNSLCEDVRLDNMPTCGVFAVECPITDWMDFPVATKSFLFFDYPKAEG